MALVRSLSFVFQFSPVLVSSVRRESEGEDIRYMPVMLRAIGGTVQHSLPVKLLMDPVELAFMQQYYSDHEWVLDNGYDGPIHILYSFFKGVFQCGVLYRRIISGLYFAGTTVLAAL